MPSIIIDALNLILEKPLAFLFSILLFILIWIYKELRNKYLENQKQDEKRTDEAISLFSELELEIHKYLEKKTEDFFYFWEKVSKVNSHLPNKMYLLAKNCKSETNEKKRYELLNQLRKDLVDEIDSLKNTQMNTFSKRNESLKDKTARFTHSTLKPFIVPIIDLYLIFVILLILYLGLRLFFSLDSIDKQLFMISLITTFIIYVVSVYLVIVDIIKKKKLPSNAYDRAGFTLFLIIPPFLTVLFPVWYVEFIVITMIIGYMVYLANKVQKMNR
ncbi:hypothetical protein [Paenibacillus sp. IITD108]|uniref:hypothetical protein n=1 Tax=Paenibacillus sp. IITD108 TaxID=3116649 RepID=UPI002F3FDED8